MEICKKKIFFILFLIFFILTGTTFSQIDFKKLGDKKVSYLDFFLLKYENQLIRRTQVLRSQIFASRVQYSNAAVKVNFDKKRYKIETKIYVVMDRNRYKKKKYSPKLRDCNQVRNLIFYNKHGYKFFTQKRDPVFSEDVMIDIFKENFFYNTDFDDAETEFLLDKMFVEVTIFHPIQKTELYCSGKINDYELK